MTDINTIVRVEGLPYDEAAWKLVAEQAERMSKALRMAEQYSDGRSFGSLSWDIYNHIEKIAEINKAAGALPDEESEGVQ